MTLLYCLRGRSEWEVGQPVRYAGFEPENENGPRLPGLLRLISNSIIGPFL